MGWLWQCNYNIGCAALGTLSLFLIKNQRVMIPEFVASLSFKNKMTNY